MCIFWPVLNKWGLTMRITHKVKKCPRSYYTKWKSIYQLRKASNTDTQNLLFLVVLPKLRGNKLVNWDMRKICVAYIWRFVKLVFVFHFTYLSFHFLHTWKEVVKQRHIYLFFSDAYLWSVHKTSSLDSFYNTQLDIQTILLLYA